MKDSPEHTAILKYIEVLAQGWRDTYEAEKISTERDKGKKALAIAQSQVAVKVLEDLVKDVKSGSYAGFIPSVATKTRPIKE